MGGHGFAWGTHWAPAAQMREAGCYGTTMDNSCKPLKRLYARSKFQESTSPEGRGTKAVYPRNDRTKGQEGQGTTVVYTPKMQGAMAGGDEGRQLYAPKKQRAGTHVQEPLLYVQTKPLYVPRPPLHLQRPPPCVHKQPL